MPRIASIAAAFARLAPIAVALGAPARAQSLRWHHPNRDVVEKAIGRAVALVDDVDGDGRPDLAMAVGRHSSGYYGGSDAVRIRSSATDEVLLEIDGSVAESFGSAIAAVDDWDGDGRRDYAIGAIGDPILGVTDGAAYVVSSATGATIRSWRGDRSGWGFGGMVASIDDVDGDGIGELVAGAPGAVDPYDSHRIGLVRVLSSRDGKALAEFWGAGYGSDCDAMVFGFGLRSSFDRLDDIDGDGRREFVLDRIEPDGTISVTIVSGATLLPIRSTILAPFGARAAGCCIASLGDLDGDGFDDLMALEEDGNVWTLSTRDLSILARDRTYTIPAVARRFGDLDGDGFDDVAVCMGYASSDVGSTSIDVRSGRTAATIATLSVVRDVDSYCELPPPAAIADAMPFDWDGDGSPDLLYGNVELDRVAVWSFARALELAAWIPLVDVRDQRLFVPFDDEDGDGLCEWLAVVREEGSSSGTVVESIAFEVTRGDGSLLRRVVRDSDVAPLLYGLSGALLVPDVDGDGRSDVVLWRETSDQSLDRVELVSTVDGHRLHKFERGADDGLGAAVAAAIEPATGRPLLAIGATTADPAGARNAGELLVYDLTTNALLWSVAGTERNEHLGSAIAALDDVDGDGLRDWAVAAPDCDRQGADSGRVAIVSGRDGHLLKELLGAAAFDRYGAQLAAVGDVDGDGIGELLVGSPSAGTSDTGRVELRSGSGFGLLAALDGPTTSSRFGDAVAAFPDLNGDGIPEWGFTSREQGGVGPDTLQIHSGATLRLLTAWRSGLDAHLGVHASAPWIVSPPVAGRRSAASIDQAGASIVDLPDVFLDVAPASAKAGASVVAATRGGPPAAYAGLELVAIDDVPFDEFLAFGTLDGFAEWSVVDDVPPGLSGTSWTLRSWCVTFGGKLGSSSERTLDFQ